MLLFRFYTRWKDWESCYSQSFGLHFSLREEQWQEDWAFILSLASQVRMLPGMLLLWKKWGSGSACLGLQWEHFGAEWYRGELGTWHQVTRVPLTADRLCDHRPHCRTGRAVCFCGKWLENCQNECFTWWFNLLNISSDRSSVTLSSRRGSVGGLTYMHCYI